MGWSFIWEHEPREIEEIRARERVADARWLASKSPADGDVARAIWRERYEAQQKHGTTWSPSYSYFYEAIKAVMIGLGMVYICPDPVMPWRDCLHDEEGGQQYRCCDVGRAIRQGLEGPGPGRGIPRYKLSSSDGWLILPEEITAALTIFEEHRQQGWKYDGDSDDARWWSHWLRYLYCARGYGGVRVY